MNAKYSIYLICKEPDFQFKIFALRPAPLNYQALLLWLSKFIRLGPYLSHYFTEINQIVIKYFSYYFFTNHQAYLVSPHFFCDSYKWIIRVFMLWFIEILIWIYLTKIIFLIFVHFFFFFVFLFFDSLFFPNTNLELWYFKNIFQYIQKLIIVWMKTNFDISHYSKLKWFKKIRWFNSYDIIYEFKRLWWVNQIVD